MPNYKPYIYVSAGSNMNRSMEESDRTIENWSPSQRKPINVGNGFYVDNNGKILYDR